MLIIIRLFLEDVSVTKATESKMSIIDESKRVQLILIHHQKKAQPTLRRHWVHMKMCFKSCLVLQSPTCTASVAHLLAMSAAYALLIEARYVLRLP